MHHIRPWLSIGTLEESQDHDTLKANGIQAVLQLHKDVTHDDIPTKFVPVTEGVPVAPADLQAGIDFVLQHMDNGEHVLVACGAGVSRSVLFSVGALARAEGVSIVKAFGDIRKQHERAMPDEMHWKALAQLFHEDVDFWQMWQEIEL